MISAHPIKLVALVALLAGGVALSLNAGTGPRATPGVEALPPESLQGPPDDGRFAAMEDRVRELERRIEAIEGVKKAQRPAEVEARTLLKVRTRVDDALVGRVYVAPGQLVKKGEPLVELRSLDLVRAKNAYQAAFVQWDHDRKYLAAREPLSKAGRITETVWADTRNDEKKSRLDYLVAGEKLKNLGLTKEELNTLLENFGDDSRIKLVLPGADLQDLSTLTLTASADGRVVEVPAEPGNYYSLKDVLIIIEVAKP